jgi:hypothetical protein
MPQGNRSQSRVLVEKDVPMQTRDGVTLAPCPLGDFFQQLSTL